MRRYTIGLGRALSFSAQDGQERDTRPGFMAHRRHAAQGRLVQAPVFPWRAQRAPQAVHQLGNDVPGAREHAFGTPLGKTAGAQARRGPSTCELGHPKLVPSTARLAEPHCSSVPGWDASDDAPLSANGGVGGNPAVIPSRAGMGGTSSMSPYCSPIGVPMVASASYLSDARPLLVDAGAPLADSGASDAGLDVDAGSTNSSLEGSVEVVIVINFAWGIPFDVGPAISLTEGVQVLTPTSSASRFVLSIPARAATAMVEFRYVWQGLGVTGRSEAIQGIAGDLNAGFLRLTAAGDSVGGGATVLAC